MPLLRVPFTRFDQSYFRIDQKRIELAIQRKVIGRGEKRQGATGQTTRAKQKNDRDRLKKRHTPNKCSMQTKRKRRTGTQTFPVQRL